MKYVKNWKENSGYYAFTVFKPWIWKMNLLYPSNEDISSATSSSKNQMIIKDEIIIHTIWEKTTFGINQLNCW